MRTGNDPRVTIGASPDDAAWDATITHALAELQDCRTIIEALARFRDAYTQERQLSQELLRATVYCQEAWDTIRNRQQQVNDLQERLDDCKARLQRCCEELCHFIDTKEG